MKQAGWESEGWVKIDGHPDSYRTRRTDPSEIQIEQGNEADTLALRQAAMELVQSFFAVVRSQCTVEHYFNRAYPTKRIVDMEPCGLFFHRNHEGIYAVFLVLVHNPDSEVKVGEMPHIALILPKPRVIGTQYDFLRWDKKMVLPLSFEGDDPRARFQCNFWPIYIDGLTGKNVRKVFDRNNVGYYFGTFLRDKGLVKCYNYFFDQVLGTDSSRWRLFKEAVYRTYGVDLSERISLRPDTTVRLASIPEDSAVISGKTGRREPGADVDVDVNRSELIRLLESLK